MPIHRAWPHHRRITERESLSLGSHKPEARAQTLFYPVMLIPTSIAIQQATPYWKETILKAIIAVAIQIPGMEPTTRKAKIRLKILTLTETPKIGTYLRLASIGHRELAEGLLAKTMWIRIDNLVIWTNLLTNSPDTHLSINKPTSRVIRLDTDLLTRLRARFRTRQHTNLPINRSRGMRQIIRHQITRILTTRHLITSHL